MIKELGEPDFGTHKLIPIRTRRQPMEPVGKPKLVDKTWGHEAWLANNEQEDYCGKILHIDANQSTSMHYHLLKHETFYVLEGTLRLELLDGQTAISNQVVLGVGETYEINRGQAHRLIARDDAVKIVEISTFHEDNDSYRVWR